MSDMEQKVQIAASMASRGFTPVDIGFTLGMEMAEVIGMMRDPEGKAALAAAKSKEVIKDVEIDDLYDETEREVVEMIKHRIVSQAHEVSLMEMVATGKFINGATRRRKDRGSAGRGRNARDDMEVGMAEAMAIREGERNKVVTLTLPAGLANRLEDVAKNGSEVVEAEVANGPDFGKDTDLGVDVATVERSLGVSLTRPDRSIGTAKVAEDVLSRSEPDDLVM